MKANSDWTEWVATQCNANSWKKTTLNEYYQQVERNAWAQD